jgi:Bacterial PH domain/Short C-terminal domain
MSYADGLLSTGERIVRRTKQHPFIFIWGARWAILAIVIAFFVGLFGSGLGQDAASGAVKSVLNVVVLVLFFGGIAVAIWTGLRYMNQEYVLTNRRVIQVEGVLNRNSTDSSLEKINDAVLSQSFFGRMFDFGDLTVLTASEAGIDAMKMLRSPIAFKKAMLDAKHEYEVGMEREGWAPSPPIREGSTAPAPAAAGGIAAAPGATPAPAVPVAPPAPKANPDEVTRTLASLADLRDRGAITPEEYETKKADLLSRL